MKILVIPGETKLDLLIRRLSRTLTHRVMVASGSKLPNLSQKSTQIIRKESGRTLSNKIYEQVNRLVNLASKSLSAREIHILTTRIVTVLRRPPKPRNQLIRRLKLLKSLNRHSVKLLTSAWCSNAPPRLTQPATGICTKSKAVRDNDVPAAIWVVRMPPCARNRPQTISNR